jgi:hypothetical protein
MLSPVVSGIINDISYLLGLHSLPDVYDHVPPVVATAGTIGNLSHAGHSEHICLL